METNDGFTFKRVKAGPAKRKATLAVGKDFDNFVFHKVKESEDIKSKIGIKDQVNKKLKTRKKAGKKLKAPKKKAEPKKSINIQDTIIEIPSDSTIKENIESANILSCSYEDTLKLNLPVEKEPLKSDELYKAGGGCINNLLLECIKFLKVESMNYAQEISRALISKKYSQNNFSAEIKNIKELIKEVDREEEKWRSVFKSVTEKNSIKIEKEEKIDFIAEEVCNEKIHEEILEKSKTLNLIEEKFSFKIDQLKSRSEVLAKNIFEAEEKPEIDPVFLLRAMTKL